MRRLRRKLVRYIARGHMRLGHVVTVDAPASNGRRNVWTCDDCDRSWSE